VDWEGLAAERGFEGGSEGVLGPHEVDTDVEVAAGEDGPADLGLGGLIGTHCIYNDVGWHQGSRSVPGRRLGLSKLRCGLKPAWNKGTSAAKAAFEEFCKEFRGKQERHGRSRAHTRDELQRPWFIQQPWFISECLMMIA
jgi:hypothetical protein